MLHFLATNITYTINNVKFSLKTRATNAVPMLVSQGPSFYLKNLVKKGHNSKNIAFQSYVLSTAISTCYDEQVFQVWCWQLWYFWPMGYISFCMTIPSDHNSSTSKQKSKQWHLNKKKHWALIDSLPKDVMIIFSQTQQSQ